MTKSKMKAHVGMILYKSHDGMTDDGYEWLKNIKYDSETYVHELITEFTSTVNELKSEINVLKGIIGNQQEEISKLNVKVQEVEKDLNELQKGAL